MRNFVDTQTDLRRIIANAEAGYTNDINEFQEVVANALTHIMNGMIKND